MTVHIKTLKGDNWGRWNGGIYFTNGVSNQYVDVIFSGGTSFWTSGMVRMHGTYSHGNISGMREYAWTRNANSGSNYNTAITNVTPSAVALSATVFTPDNWAWNGSNHYLRIRKANSVGNSCNIDIEIYQHGWYADYFSLGSLGTY